MPLKISHESIKSACGYKGDYVRRKFRASLQSERLYDVASLLTTLDPFRHAPEIVNQSFDDEELIVSNDEELVEAFEREVISHPEFYIRARDCQKAFTFALIGGAGTHLYIPHLESLRSSVLLDSRVMRYVFTGKGFPPSDSKWAEAFAIVNVRVDELAVAA